MKHKVVNLISCWGKNRYYLVAVSMCFQERYCIIASHSLSMNEVFPMPFLSAAGAFGSPLTKMKT